MLIANTNGHNSGNVYIGRGIAPTIMAGTHGYGFGYVIEVKKWKKK